MRTDYRVSVGYRLHIVSYMLGLYKLFVHSECIDLDFGSTFADDNVSFLERHYRLHPTTLYDQGGSVVYLLKRRTCDREVASSTPSRSIAGYSLGQLSLPSPGGRQIEYPSAGWN